MHRVEAPEVSSAPASAQDFQPAVDLALRAVVGHRGWWENTLTCAVHIAATHAVLMSAKAKQHLLQFHAPLHFQADGRPAQRAPALRLTRKGAGVGGTVPPSEIAELGLACKLTSVRPAPVGAS